MSVRFLSFAVAVLMLPVVNGCGGEVRVPVFPVSGKISFQGKPPVGAQIVLHPVDRSQPNDVTPSGGVTDDGSFKITAYELDDGAPQGEYVATIEWFKIVSAGGGGGGRGPNVLPKKYASAQTSPIKVSVKNGPTVIPPITIQ